MAKFEVNLHSFEGILYRFVSLCCENYKPKCSNTKPTKSISILLIKCLLSKSCGDTSTFTN